ncbi:MAG: hypothetical protein A2381_06115 [Bdellovibrionales bacterium RIFOXYB1_FULL_37_110]|nr:MAG: hypothetical protein A2417_05000 [Bdellovibrionales bacterium RIFOXYC1_FULL_37_79]OFZ59393.1 MAG: hypothetical protein A2381_06115 [Bdellovibrionales bacterium RIFOXYB1_FULL_37_110]OFZ61953.1 MAG: hypothetical protein A2577_18000 [Bdellovibrionales bacterium RIFOXYD1_FULL_36_51]
MKKFFLISVLIASFSSYAEYKPQRCYTVVKCYSHLITSHHVLSAIPSNVVRELAKDYDLALLSNISDGFTFEYSTVEMNGGVVGIPKQITLKSTLGVKSRLEADSKKMFSGYSESEIGRIDFLGCTQRDLDCYDYEQQ